MIKEPRTKVLIVLFILGFGAFEGSGVIMEYIIKFNPKPSYTANPLESIVQPLPDTIANYLSMSGIVLLACLFIWASSQAQKQINYDRMLEAWISHADDCPCDT